MRIVTAEDNVLLSAGPEALLGARGFEAVGVAAGGTVMDPEAVARLLARRDGDPVDALTRREREVTAPMAEGTDDRETAARLVVGDNAVHEHIGDIFAKLDPAPADPGHRRVRAVLAHLDGWGAPR